MKKYNTRPIDFTGCHPVIAEALKRGEAIECRVWDCEDSPCQLRKKWVCSYSKEESCSYISTEGIVWRYAEPTTIKVHRIMPPEQAIPVLIANGWEYNKEGALVGEPPIVSSMFKEMGGLLDKSRAVWPSCIVYESGCDDE